MCCGCGWGWRGGKKRRSEGTFEGLGGGVGEGGERDNSRSSSWW